MALTKITSRILDSSGVTIVGTISTGVWQGTAIASAYLDADTAHLSTTQTFTGAKTFSSDATFSGSINTSGNLQISNGSPNVFFHTTGNHYNWMIGAQENVSTAFEISVDGATGTGSDTTASNYTPVITALASGKVCIAATDPVKTLDVRGQLSISNGSSSYWYLDRNNSNGNFELFDDGDNAALTIDTSRNATFSNNLFARRGSFGTASNFSFDLYNNGTSYFNGAVTIDDNATIAGDIALTGDSKIQATADLGIGARNGTTNAGAVYIGGANDNPFISPTAFFGTDGKVGIGITSPSSKLSVANPSSSTGSAAAGRLADSSIHLIDTTDVGRYSQITFGYPTNNTHASAYIGYVSTSNSASGKGDLVFGTKNNTAYNTQPSERLRIESDGTVRVKTGSIVVDTAGKGIFLGGTATANNLDDYEEGSWTPTLSTTGGSVGTASSAGQYTKIGRQVIVHFQFTLSSSSGGSGSLLITNLPFTVAANSGAVTGSGRILDLGQAIAVGHYTSTNQISIFKYNGNYAGTDFFTTGFVTYYVA